MPGKVACTCGKEYRWKPELAGKKARCKCGGVIHIPARDPDVPEEPVEAAPEGFDDMFALANAAAPAEEATTPPPYNPGAAATPSRRRASRSAGATTTPVMDAPPMSGAPAPKNALVFNRKILGYFIGGLICLGMGINFFVQINNIEASGDQAVVVGRGQTAGLLKFAMWIGGKWGVMGLFILFASCCVFLGVQTMRGKISPDEE